MHTVFTVRPSTPRPPPVNKHSGPEDTIYANHSGASIKTAKSPPCFLNPMNEKVDPVVSLINTTCPGETEAYFYFFFRERERERERRYFSLNSSDSSDPWLKMVTDFHYLNIRDTKRSMRMERFPGRKGGWQRASGVFLFCFFSKLSTAYRDPLVLPKWSNQISASSEHVPLKKTKQTKNKTQLLSLKLTGLRWSRRLV